MANQMTAAYNYNAHNPSIDCIYKIHVNVIRLEMGREEFDVFFRLCDENILPFTFHRLQLFCGS